VPVRVGSLKTSSQRSKLRLDVTMIEPLSFLAEIRLNSISQPVLTEGDVAELIQDHQVVSFKAPPVIGELVVAHGLLEFHDEVGHGGEQHIVPLHASGNSQGNGVRTVKDAVGAA